MTSRMKCSDGDAVLDRIDTKMGDSVSSVTSKTSVDDAKAKRTPNLRCSSTQTSLSLNYIPHPNDVLTLKGAAAQQTQHPGNLYFNRLCEEEFTTYNNYSDLIRENPKNKIYVQKRKQIMLDIIQQIKEQKPDGGKFRSHDGRIMKDSAILKKTKSRMYQIKLPKQVAPTYVGANDVVFCDGAKNRLFAGNAQLRTLMGDYEQDYSHGLFPAKLQIMNDIIDIIVHNRGGVFRDKTSLDEISVDPVTVVGRRGRQLIIDKLRQRFLDMKKSNKLQLKNDIRVTTNLGTAAVDNNINRDQEEEEKLVVASILERIVSTICNNNNNNNNGNVTNYNLDHSNNSTSTVNIIHATCIVKRTGCTSVQSTITMRTKSNSTKRKKGTQRTTTKKLKKTNTYKYDDNDGDEEEDDYADYDSDTDDDNDDDDDKKMQAVPKSSVSRAERLKQRNEQKLHPPSQKAKPKVDNNKKRRRNKPPVLHMPSEAEVAVMSDYEKLRYYKMKRNQERLAVLGLL